MLFIYIDQFIVSVTNALLFNFLKNIFSVIMHLRMIVIARFMAQKHVVRLFIILFVFQNC